MTAGGVSPVPREARAFQGEPAGVVTRVAANVIDSVVACGLVLAGYVVLNGLVFLVDPSGFQPVGAPILFSVMATLVVMVLYLALAWTVVGRTYGCHVMGLRVVGRKGRRLGPLTALVRAVMCVLFPIGLFWCAVSTDRRSVQDLLLRTSVVYDWLPAHDEIP